MWSSEGSGILRANSPGWDGNGLYFNTRRAREFLVSGFVLGGVILIDPHETGKCKHCDSPSRRGWNVQCECGIVFFKTETSIIESMRNASYALCKKCGVKRNRTKRSQRAPVRFSDHSNILR